MALIYLIEDDASIREIEEYALKNAGYEVATFEKASSFFNALEDIMPDLIVLDVMLPDENGIDIVKQLRGSSITKALPVIMVTAKTSELDLVKGLENGADDYIKKPFSVLEFISRVKAMLRRTLEDDVKKLELDELLIDKERHEVKISDTIINLTYKEYELLYYLALNRGIVLRRDQIMERIWGIDYEGESRTLDMHIKTLRQKLGTFGSRIRTVRNVGYVIE
ncbi:MAG: response regulator transcription factor [Pseudobutyrivibrio sp.]|uniref:response regulator n=1 Tax=Pseudobutyrivibrio sp. TaxID=2014367 RepID=UPI0025EC9A2E|nr:response regulator transcription factor [Pseudobutyrivibrio sp.]MBQ6462665.1 response regulator transcription factor [Pseudobutyrivibrio sp.]